MGIDLSELDALTGRLAASGEVVQREGAAVVNRGALNVKNGWRDRARTTAGAHARLYPGSISYDNARVVAPGVLEAVIGPDKARPQGALGNLLEFGSVNNGPHNDGGLALDEEEPRFVAQVEALGQRAAEL